MTMTVEEALMCADEFAVKGCGSKVLAAEVRRLRAENSMLTEQRDEHAQNSANATTQCLAYQQEVADLREQLAQERKRLDWALSCAAICPEPKTKLWIEKPCGRDKWYPVQDGNYRATIDELIAAEAA